MFYISVYYNFLVITSMPPAKGWKHKATLTKQQPTKYVS